MTLLMVYQFVLPLPMSECFHGTHLLLLYSIIEVVIWQVQAKP
jgi:hypothetical protein